ncbi:MAG TPA: [Fe-Fe] hydrogenase large subunit C-terminal domain-containing protein [Candidatus Bathyarchaeia archaeon]|nr:[Fe-Fe] hydrogenase large subunit C-terminal domain-containing protein [Candidatus Bathyarchaeia archaeon]
MPETQELKTLINLLKSKTPLTAMLAPAFVIDFPFPQIVGKLKRLGFKFVIEVAVGAIDTNRQALLEFKKHPQKKLITSPCPSIYQMIKTQYPQLLPFLSKSDSPMIATARIVREKFPETKAVFIGPCVVKKIEAARYPDLNILSVTFKDISQVFKHFNIKASAKDNKAEFDLATCNTRIYPVSGGLSESANLDQVLKKDQYRIVSGIKEVKAALAEFEKNNHIRFLDILFCFGGCINGLGINNTSLVLAQRKKKVLQFWNQCLSKQNDLEKL